MHIFEVSVEANNMDYFSIILNHSDFMHTLVDIKNMSVFSLEHLIKDFY